MASGEYINLNEFAYNLKDVFAEKGLSWFEKFKNKLVKKRHYDEYSYGEEALEFNSDYVINTK
jgi:hypothetical protein